MADDRDQVGIAHFVERVAFGEGMRLHGKIVHVGNPLRGGLRIMAADAILRVELRSHGLLVAQRDLVEREVDVFPDASRVLAMILYRPACCPSVDGARDLSTGIGQRCRRA